MPGAITIPDLEKRIVALKASQASLLRKLREIRAYADGVHVVTVDNQSFQCTCVECNYKRKLITLLETNPPTPPTLCS